MVEKFDPAPFDGHAEDVTAAANRKTSSGLASGLEGSFPVLRPAEFYSTLSIPSRCTAANIMAADRRNF
jgi:hypothetical protein